MWYKSYSYNLQKGLLSLKAWWSDLQFDYNSFLDICWKCETTWTGWLQSENNAENTRNKKNLVSHLWCLHSCDAFKISQNTSSEQNLQEHGENLGSKLTNHKMTKFPERSEAYLFSLQEALCFLLQCYWFVYKKSLTSFVLNKHVHWFIFLHFDPVQIISLLWALHKLYFLSFIHDFSGCVVIVTELVASPFEL